MGTIWLFFSCTAVLIASGAQTALDLLTEQENELQQRRLTFDDWCQRELANQEGLSTPLPVEKDSEPISEPFQVSPKLFEAAKKLEEHETELRIANLTASCLTMLEKDLIEREARFGESGRRAVRKLLVKATESVTRLSLGPESPKALAASLETLKAGQRSFNEALAARESRALAAGRSRQALDTALSQLEAARSDAAGLCGLGHTVLNRSESRAKLLSRRALELLGMLEAEAPSTPPELLKLSRELQVEQREIREELDALKLQLEHSTVPPAPTEPTAAPNEPTAAPVAKPEPVPRPRKHTRPMSLAAESHGTVAQAKETSTTAAPKVELPELQAPKDFPAALRGGWQGLLAKKRVKKVKDEASSIMELMQTPKTYTAWQPEKASVPEKSDLLAAEKAFDDDDAPKGAKSFLQMDPEPLAFFQLSSILGMAAPTYAAPHAESEVSLLLSKFGEQVQSRQLRQLSKSQLEKKDLELLIERLNGESVAEPSAEFCAQAGVEPLRAELERHYLQAKARLAEEALATALAAHGRLSQALRSGSERQGALLGALRQSFGREERRLQALEQMLKQLEAGKEGQRPAKELHEILVEFHATLQHSQEELEDALASASSRHRQAEIMEEAGLGQLRHAPAATPTPQKLEKLCALAAEGLAERRWQHAAQLAALETAHALADELS